MSNKIKMTNWFLNKCLEDGVDTLKLPANYTQFRHLLEEYDEHWTSCDYKSMASSE